jgi:hypothetical protein
LKRLEKNLENHETYWNNPGKLGDNNGKVLEKSSKNLEKTL